MPPPPRRCGGGAPARRASARQSQAESPCPSPGAAVAPRGGGSSRVRLRGAVSWAASSAVRGTRIRHPPAMRGALPCIACIRGGSLLFPVHGVVSLHSFHIYNRKDMCWCWVNARNAEIRHQAALRSPTIPCNLKHWSKCEGERHFLLPTRFPRFHSISALYRRGGSSPITCTHFVCDGV